MSTINRQFFFDQVNLRLFDGKLPAKAKDSLNQILDYWEANQAGADERWLAYALGTAHHETDRTFGPIREYVALFIALAELHWSSQWKSTPARISCI
jgi:hypothetical protein